MKKLLFLTAIVSLLFVGCSNDNGDYNNDNGNYNNGPSKDVKLLPSRIIVTGVRTDTIDFLYDDLNRLVRMTTTGLLYHWGGTSPRQIIDTIIYDANGNPIQFGDRHIRYNGNQIFVDNIDGRRGDTLIADDNGRLEKILWPFSYWRRTSTFVYSSDGELAKVTHRPRHHNLPKIELHFRITDSTAKSIWRYLNAPEWFVTYFLSFVPNYGFSEYLYVTKRGLMPTKIVHHIYFYSFYYPYYPFLDVSYYVIVDYSLNRKGYINSISLGPTHWAGAPHWHFEIEYILAR